MAVPRRDACRTGHGHDAMSEVAAIPGLVFYRLDGTSCSVVVVFILPFVACIFEDCLGLVIVGGRIPYGLLHFGDDSRRCHFAVLRFPEEVRMPCGYGLREDVVFGKIIENPCKHDCECIDCQLGTILRAVRVGVFGFHRAVVCEPVVGHGIVVVVVKDGHEFVQGHFVLVDGIVGIAARGSHVYEVGFIVLPGVRFFLDFFQAGVEVDVVISPAIGGILMGYEVARQLGKPNIFAERENGVMTLRRGFTIEKGTKFVVCEDVVTTGGSVKEVIALVKEAGGEVSAVASLVDRSNGKVDFGVKFVNLISMDITSYEPDECPLCKEGKIELVKPGSRVFTK